MAAIASIFRAVTYRGGAGQVAWMLHRVTGVGVFVFLALHILNIFLMSFPSHVFNSVVVLYQSVLFKLLTIFGVYLGVLYHALNGIRVMIVDFWPGAGKYQMLLWRMQLVAFVVVFVPSAAIMLERMF